MSDLLWALFALFWELSKVFVMVALIMGVLSGRLVWLSKYERDKRNRHE